MQRRRNRKLIELLTLHIREITLDVFHFDGDLFVRGFNRQDTDALRLAAFRA